MSNTTNSREFLLVWDSTMTNPNGEMLSDNRPKLDETTGFLEVSDFRIKKFARDAIFNSINENILTETTLDENDEENQFESDESEE